MNLPDRKHNRLSNYDYDKKGCYFITLCTQNKQQIFKLETPCANDNLKSITQTEANTHNRVGNGLCAVPQANTTIPLQNQIVYKWIKETENKFENIRFEKTAIMPDHLHFMIRITERHAGRSLRDVMQFFKTMTTNEYIRLVKQDMLPPFDKKLWQKSYYDHIIRNQEDYNEKWTYIDNNPTKWIITHK